MRHPKPSRPPLRGANPAQALRRFFSQYLVFTGRASRSEYWWWMLANFVVGVVLEVVAVLTSVDLQWESLMYAGGNWPATGRGTVVGVLAIVYSLVVLVPSLAVLWRRLHDVGRSGLWALIVLVPFVGWLVLLVLLVGKEDPAGARFDVPADTTGPDAPLGFSSRAWPASRPATGCGDPDGGGAPNGSDPPADSGLSKGSRPSADTR